MLYNKNKWTGKLLTVLLVAAIIMLNIYSLMAAPGGATVTYNRTENVTPAPGSALTTAGGSFTTLALNLTSQTLKWKAYVGNITGKFTLDDADNHSIYDWEIQNIAGEVYVSRNLSLTWSDMRCADNSMIKLEMELLNHNDTMTDSLNKTFNQTVHKGFFVSTIWINSSSCPSIATYVNDTSQTPDENAQFQEVLLRDDSSMVYVGILEDSIYGFDFEAYDFQIIIAENEFDGPTTYYFWAELT